MSAIDLRILSIWRWQSLGGSWRGVIAVVLLLAAVSPSSPTIAIAEEQPESTAPIIGGIPLQSALAGSWPVHFDEQVEFSVRAQAISALEEARDIVPGIAGLPPITTPLQVHVLADQARFRQAIAELGGVRSQLLGPQVTGYAIERAGTTLIFLSGGSVSTRTEATIIVSHELAHVAINQVIAGHSLPQWANEGYAEWISRVALEQWSPEDAATLAAADRAVIASALRTRRALIPLADLAGRTRFGRSGADGLSALAFAQSKQFIGFLIERHGTAGIERYLHAIGQGVRHPRAFDITLGSLDVNQGEFVASLAELAPRFPVGLHVLSPTPRAGQFLLLAVVGGEPGEMATIEISSDGLLEVEAESVLDAAGYLLLGLSPQSTSAPGLRHIRVVTPSLGELEADLLLEPALTSGYGDRSSPD